MNIRQSCMLAIVAIVFCTDIYAKDYGSELISACASIQLRSCVMTGRVVQSDQLSKYEKAFNCVKNGSTNGDSFNLGFPLPDLGNVGVGSASTATYSTETCKEEVKKLDSANFFKQFSETFDRECGRTLAGQYQQCIEAATRLSENASAHSLQCSAFQSANQIVINTRYMPVSGDGPRQYRIRSVTGIDGVNCEKGTYAGVNQYSSLSCSLPNGYKSSQLIIKLGNNVTCSVPVHAERKQEIEIARKYSCSSIYNAALVNQDEFFSKMPSLLKTTLIGLCETCVSENTKTPDYDQRTLSKRMAGCAVWALRSVAEANAQFCSVKATNSTSPLTYGAPYYGGFGAPGTPPPPPVFPTAQGTERESYSSLSLDTSNPDPNGAWANSLCNGRKQGEIIQLHGEQWKKIPIDYLSTVEAQDPKMKDVINVIEASFK
jgi:hypothetical protein